MTEDLLDRGAPAPRGSSQGGLHQYNERHALGPESSGRITAIVAPDRDLFLKLDA